MFEKECSLQKLWNLRIRLLCTKLYTSW